MNKTNMDKSNIVNTFTANVDQLRNTECSQKEKIACFQHIAHCITSPAMAAHINYANHCSRATNVLLLFCEDLDSVVRMSAEENLNKIFRVLERTRVSRILMDLYGEIKRNGNQRSLRICLNLFSYYAPQIREKHLSWYALRLVPCMQTIAQRKETQLSETLCEFVKSFSKYVQFGLTDSDTCKLLEIFLANVAAECAVKRRCSAQNCISLIENARNKSLMAKHGLNKVIELLLSDHQTHTVLGALGLLRLLLPMIIRGFGNDYSDDDDNDYNYDELPTQIGGDKSTESTTIMSSSELVNQNKKGFIGVTPSPTTTTATMTNESKQIIEIYDYCLHLLSTSNNTSSHSTINAALEVINGILQAVNDCLSNPFSTINSATNNSASVNNASNQHSHGKRNKQNNVETLKCLQKLLCNQQLQHSEYLRRRKSLKNQIFQLKNYETTTGSAIKRRIGKGSYTTGDGLSLLVHKNPVEQSEKLEERNDERQSGKSSEMTESSTNRGESPTKVQQQQLHGREAFGKDGKEAATSTTMGTIFVSGNSDNSTNRVCGKPEVHHATDVDRDHNARPDFDIGDNDETRRVASHAHAHPLNDDVDDDNEAKKLISIKNKDKQLQQKQQQEQEQQSHERIRYAARSISECVVDEDDGNANPILVTDDDVPNDDDGDFAIFSEINEPQTTYAMSTKIDVDNLIDAIDATTTTTTIKNKEQSNSNIIAIDENIENEATVQDLNASDCGNNDDKSQHLSDIDNESFNSIDFESEITIGGAAQSSIGGVAGGAAGGTTKSSSDTIGSFFNNLISHSNAASDSVSKLFRQSSGAKATSSTLKTISMSVEKQSPSDENDDVVSATISISASDTLSLMSTASGSRRNIGEAIGTGCDDSLNFAGTTEDTFSTTASITPSTVVLFDGNTTRGRLATTASATELSSDDMTESMMPASNADMRRKPNVNPFLPEHSPLKQTIAGLPVLSLCIGSIHEQPIIYYTARLIAARFLLTGESRGSLHDDAIIRISIKSLSLTVLAQCVRLKPAVLQLPLEVTTDELGQLDEMEVGSAQSSKGSSARESPSQPISSNSSNLSTDYEQLEATGNAVVDTFPKRSPFSGAASMTTSTVLDESLQLLEIKDDHFGQSTCDHLLNQPLSHSADPVLFARQMSATGPAKRSSNVRSQLPQSLSKSDIVTSKREVHATPFNITESFADTPPAMSPPRPPKRTKSIRKSKTAAGVSTIAKDMETVDAAATPNASAAGPTAAVAPQLMKDILFYYNHADPMLRGGVQQIIGNFLQASGAGLTLQYGQCDLQQLLAILLKGLQDEIHTVVIQALNAFDKMFPHVVSKYLTRPPVVCHYRKCRQDDVKKLQEQQQQQQHEKYISKASELDRQEQDIPSNQMQQLHVNDAKCRMHALFNSGAHFISTVDDAMPTKCPRAFFIDNDELIDALLLNTFQLQSKFNDNNTQSITQTQSKIPTTINASCNANIIEITRTSNVLTKGSTNTEVNPFNAAQQQQQQQNQSIVDCISFNNDCNCCSYCCLNESEFFISPKLLLNKLRLCYHNKYWLVQNKYAEVISNINLSLLNSYYENNINNINTNAKNNNNDNKNDNKRCYCGNHMKSNNHLSSMTDPYVDDGDVASVYESLFLDELLQLIGDDDFRVREHAAECLCRFIMQNAKHQKQQYDQVKSTESVSLTPTKTAMTKEKESITTTANTSTHRNSNGDDDSLKALAIETYQTNFNLLWDFFDYRIFCSMPLQLRNLFRVNAAIPPPLMDVPSSGASNSISTIYGNMAGTSIGLTASATSIGGSSSVSSIGTASMSAAAAGGAGMTTTTNGYAEGHGNAFAAFAMQRELLQEEKVLAKVLYRLTNKLMKLNDKNLQFGIIYTLKVLLLHFNFVDFQRAWKEFNFAEICLKFCYYNYTTAVDLNCQNDLIDVTGKLLAGTILSTSHIEDHQQQLHQLLTHTMKIINIYFHLYTNQKPLLFAKAHKTDLFTNSKELAIVQSVGYFGNDYVYIKLYNILKSANDSYKITINQESGSILISLLRTCLNTLNLCIELRAHNFVPIIPQTPTKGSKVASDASGTPTHASPFNKQSLLSAASPSTSASSSPSMSASVPLPANAVFPSNSVLKLIEENLQYLTKLINYAPVECIGCLRQLLKYLFAQNYGNRQQDYYATFIRPYFVAKTKIFKQRQQKQQQQQLITFVNNEIIFGKSQQQQQKHQPEKIINFDATTSLARQGSGQSNCASDYRLFGGLLEHGLDLHAWKSERENECARHIKLFEPLVIYCLTLFFKSNARVQAPILELLYQLLDLNVTYSILDSKNVIFDQIISNLELIESGVARNGHIIIPPMIKFLIQLTHKSDRKLITIPKIISITNNLLATTSIRECAVLALKALSFEIIFMSSVSAATTTSIHSYTTTHTQSKNRSISQATGQAMHPRVPYQSPMEWNRTESETGGRHRTPISTPSQQRRRLVTEEAAAAAEALLAHRRELDTQKEVVLGMLEKFIDAGDCQQVLGLLLLHERCARLQQCEQVNMHCDSDEMIKNPTEDCGNMDAQMNFLLQDPDAVYGMVCRAMCDGLIRVNDWNDFFILEAFFRNNGKNVLSDSKEFLSLLQLLITKDVANFSDLAYATIILANVIPKTEEIYLVNHIKLYLKNHPLVMDNEKLRQQQQQQKHQSFAMRGYNIDGPSTSAAAASMAANIVHSSCKSPTISEINYFANVLCEKLKGCLDAIIKVEDDNIQLEQHKSRQQRCHNTPHCGMVLRFVRALNEVCCRSQHKDALQSVFRLVLAQSEFLDKYIYGLLVAATGDIGGAGMCLSEVEQQMGDDEKFNSLAAIGNCVNYTASYHGYHNDVVLLLQLEIFKLLSAMKLLDPLVFLQEIQKVDGINWNVQRMILNETCHRKANPLNWTLQQVQLLFGDATFMNLNFLIAEHFEFVCNLCEVDEEFCSLLQNALLQHAGQLNKLTIRSILRLMIRICIDESAQQSTHPHTMNIIDDGNDCLLNRNQRRCTIKCLVKFLQLLSKLHRLHRTRSQSILFQLERSARRLIACSIQDKNAIYDCFIQSGEDDLLLTMDPEWLVDGKHSALAVEASPSLSSSSSVGETAEAPGRAQVECLSANIGNRSGNSELMFTLLKDLESLHTMNADDSPIEMRIIDEKWLFAQLIKFSTQPDYDVRQLTKILLEIQSENKLHKIFNSDAFGVARILPHAISSSLLAMLTTFRNNCIQHNPHIHYMRLNPLARVACATLMARIALLLERNSHADAPMGNEGTGGAGVAGSVRKIGYTEDNTTITMTLDLAGAIIALIESIKQIEATSVIYIEWKFIDKFLRENLLRRDNIQLLLNYLDWCCKMLRFLVCDSKVKQQHEQHHNIETLLHCIDVLLKEQFIWNELNQIDKSFSVQHANSAASAGGDSNCKHRRQYTKLLCRLLDVLYWIAAKCLQSTIFYKRFKLPMAASISALNIAVWNDGKDMSNDYDNDNDNGDADVNIDQLEKFVEAYGPKAIFIAKLIETHTDIGTASNGLEDVFDGMQLEMIQVSLHTISSIGISVLRSNQFYAFAVTPYEIIQPTHAANDSPSYGNSPIKGSPRRRALKASTNGKLPTLPVESLSDVDVLHKFVKRLSIFGFTTRQQFEEYFMTFLLLINKVYDENMVDQQEQFQIKCTCLEAILELLITYKTFPIVGNKLSQFHHTTRWSRVNCDTVSLKKLHKVQMLISDSNIFYYPNLERRLTGDTNSRAPAADSVIGTKDFQRNQFDLNFAWQQMEVYAQPQATSTSSLNILEAGGGGDVININNPISSATDSSAADDVATRNYRYFTQQSGVDFKSSSQLIFDVLMQIIEHNHILVLPNLVKFTEICESRDQIKWIKEKALKLQETIPMDDTISHQHLIYLVCKTQAMLIPTYSELQQLCTLIGNYLKSSHIFIRNATLSGLLCLLECCYKTNTTIGRLSEELALLRDLIIGYINRHGIIDESQLNCSDTHAKLVWTLNYCLIEWTSKFVPQCHLLSNTIIAANNFLRRTNNDDIYLCVLHGLERIVVTNNGSFESSGGSQDNISAATKSNSKGIVTPALHNKIEKLALDLVKLDNEVFSIPALKLLLSCMYIGSSAQLENTELSNGIVQDDPEIIAQQTDKVDVLLHCIKSSTRDAAWIYGEVLCQIIRDLVPPNEILTKVIKELLAINQPHCDVIAMIVYQVFRSAIDSSFLPMLQDWLICSLPTFLAQSVQKGVWGLSVIFLSASINLHLIKLFPVLLGAREFRKLGQHEIALFITSAQDFHAKLSAEQKLRFRDVFKKYQKPSVYAKMLHSL